MDAPPSNKELVMNAEMPLWLCDIVIGLVDFVAVLAILLPIGGLLTSLALLARPRASRTRSFATPREHVLPPRSRSKALSVNRLREFAAVSAAA